MPRQERKGGGPMNQSHSFAKPKNTKHTLARLLGYLSRSTGWLLLVIALLLFSTGTMLISNYFLKPLINDYILPGDFSGLARSLVILGVIVLAGVVAMLFQNRILIKIAQNTVNTLRRELFEKMQSLPLKFFDSHPHGELMSRFTNDIDTIMTTLEQSTTQLISSAVTFVGTLIMMLLLSPMLTLITALVLALMLFLSTIIGKRSRKNFMAQQATIGELNGFIEEIIEGQKVVKVFNHEPQAQAQFDGLNEKYRKAATSAQIFSGIIMPIMFNLNNVSYALTAAVGGIMVLTGFGAFDIGALAAFLGYSRTFGQPVMQISNQLNNVFAALAGAERIFEIMDKAPELDDGLITLVPAAKDTNGQLSICKKQKGNDRHWAWHIIRADGGSELVELKGDVRFSDVTFTYDGEKTVLQDVSLFAKPGQKIAFVGSTGAGKTTITNLINRFYDVQQGRITYDGIDVKDIKKADLRHSLGMVLQDTHLFTGTVADNIRYGRLEATDEEIVAASKRASAHSFIKRLPQGYDTVITGDGSNLSQGQRQLLAIARAAVADPPVLILDEATSSIDTRTERLIEKGMDALMEGRTVFVIAHRLSTVRNAKAIMVLEHGKIIERGDHDDLLAQQGRYYQLYTGQFMLE